MTDKNNFVDLHVHTIYSDGILSPQEVVKKAIERDLKAIAITDHDCIDGIKPAIEAAKDSDLEIVPGVEVSASIGEREIHVLAYFIDINDEHLLSLLDLIRGNRVNRLKKMLYLLKENGVDLAEEKVLSNDICGTVGRLHLARVMVEEGVVRNTATAFERYIADGKPCCVKHEKVDYKQAFKIIKESGGVPVLAHPGTSLLDEYIPELVSAGLRGLEVFHTRHHKPISEKYKAMADKNGLLITGGSDCHGLFKNNMLLGKVKVSYDVIDALRRESEGIVSRLKTQNPGCEISDEKE